MLGRGDHRRLELGVRTLVLHRPQLDRPGSEDDWTVTGLPS
jgi:hypothetical protein